MRRADNGRWHRWKCTSATSAFTPTIAPIATIPAAPPFWIGWPNVLSWVDLWARTSKRDCKKFPNDAPFNGRSNRPSPSTLLA